MAQLGFFLFLLMQATFMGWGLFFIAALAVFLVIRGERRALFLALPLAWLLPLIVSAVFYEAERGMKSADWTGYLALASLAGFVAASMAMLMRREGRAAALGWIGVNAPVALVSALVTGIAAGGTWP